MSLKRFLQLFSSPKSSGGRTSSGAGFTLVELLVVVGIITVITVGLLARYGQFNNTILLRSLAYDVALSIRQAQTYGLSVREGQSTGSFELGYGVYVSSGNPTAYILFADLNRNSRYDGDTESSEVFTIRRGHGIARFCATLASGVERCAPGELTSLSIAFQRPDPDAVIRTDISNESYVSAYIEMESPAGERARVDVASTGQVSVEEPQAN